VGALFDAGLFPIGIGGGHDLTFPFVRAAVKHRGVSAGVYFDAHTDVRETPGSGMAFRRLIEDCGIRKLHLHGSDPYANSAEHVGWLRSHGGMDLEKRDSTSAAYSLPRGDLFASFDLDVLDASQAPGVSATNPAGWSAQELSAFASSLAREPRVRCMDIMELNPIHDEGGRTARLAARLFLTMLRGFAERKA
jgi:formiminoglutamase